MAKKTEKADLEKDIHASAARVEELRAGRNLGDIPMNDPYWEAQAHHQRAHYFKQERKDDKQG